MYYIFENGSFMRDLNFRPKGGVLSFTHKYIPVAAVVTKWWSNGRNETTAEIIRPAGRPLKIKIS